jgi:hypothetical protein
MLQRINACNVGNQWFLIDEGYLIAVFHEILFGLRVKEYSFEEISYPQIMQDLDVQFPFELILIDIAEEIKAYSPEFPAELLGVHKCCGR